MPAPGVRVLHQREGAMEERGLPPGEMAEARVAPGFRRCTAAGLRRVREVMGYPAGLEPAFTLSQSVSSTLRTRIEWPAWESNPEHPWF